MKSTPQPPRRRWILLSSLVVVLAAAGVWGYSQSRAEPAAESALPEEYSKEKLAALADNPGEMFRTIRLAMDRADLTDQQKDALRESAFELREAREQAEVDRYFAASEGERQAILDEAIDRMEQWRRDRERERNSAASQPSDRRDRRRDRPPPSQAERKTRSETRSPDKQARQMAYRKAMRERMQQRGIQPPRWGGPGGPGGRGGPGGGSRA